ncbi:MAG: hypothetical protein WD576_02590 [Nitriliruptoraceae bacterium]
MDSDDARTDVILVAAAALFGGTLRGIVSQLPGYPRQGLAAAILNIAWVVAVTALVPWLLSRYRGDRAAAFALDGSRFGRWLGIRAGLVLAVPPVIAMVSLGMLAGISPQRWIFGRFAAAANIAAVLVAAGLTVALTAGATLLVTFLSHRGSAWGRTVDMRLTQLLRTFGIASAALAVVTGLVRSIRGPSPLAVIVFAATIMVLVLTVDRWVPSGVSIPRTAMLAPVIVVGLLHLFATGGLFRGDLITALYSGSLAVGMTVIVVAATHVTRIRWAVVPLMIAVHWWPSCLSPLALEVARAC